MEASFSPIISKSFEIVTLDLDSMPSKTMILPLSATNSTALAKLATAVSIVSPSLVSKPDSLT